MYLLAISLYTALFWGFFHRTGAWLIHSWLNNEFYQHGLVIATLGLGVFSINALRVKVLDIKQSRGLIVLFVFALLCAAGIRGKAAFLTAAAFVPGAVYLTKTMVGKDKSAYLTRPLWLLLLSVPLPFWNEVRGYMSYAAVKATAWLLGTVFSSVEVNGIEIMLEPGIAFKIGLNCTGTGAMVGLLSICAIWLALSKDSKTVIASTLCAIVPVAFGTNILRIVIIFVIAKYISMGFAADFWHNFSGILFYACALITMFSIWLAAKKITHDKIKLRTILINEKD